MILIKGGLFNYAAQQALLTKIKELERNVDLTMLINDFQNSLVTPNVKMLTNSRKGKVVASSITSPFIIYHLYFLYSI